MKELKKINGYSITEEFESKYTILTLIGKDRRAISTINSKGDFTLNYRIYGSNNKDDKFEKNDGNKPSEFLIKAGFDESAVNEFITLINARCSMRPRSIKPNQ